MYVLILRTDAILGSDMKVMARGKQSRTRCGLLWTINSGLSENTNNRNLTFKSWKIREDEKRGKQASLKK